MSDEKRSERNEKRRERYKMNNQGRVDLDNNVAIHSIDGNTTNETDKNSDKLHMHSTYSNGANQLSDGLVPLSSIGGTSYVDDIETGSGYAPSPINRLVTCSKERKRVQCLLNKGRYRIRDDVNCI